MTASTSGSSEPCSHAARIVSAHRTPERLSAFARGARAAGFKVIVAGAGGAAHLPGMLASVTPLPVIGVPVPLENLDGLDSLLSIVQMPAGVPVSGLESDGGDLFFCGGSRTGRLRSVRRPGRRPARGGGSGIPGGSVK